MLFKIQLLVFIIIYGKTCAMIVKSNGTSNNLIEAIEENQGLGMDCSIYSNSIERFIIEYKQMNRSLTIDCQLHLKSTTKKLKSTVDAMVEHNFNDVVLLIRSGLFSVGREQVSQFGEIYFIKIISAVYGKNTDDAEILIEFFNSFSDENLVILGYRLLFDQMKNHIYSTVTTTIAYRVFVDFTNIKNENFLYLKANLPESYQKFPWNKVVFVGNGKLEQLFRFWWHPPFYYDNLRLNPYTHSAPADGHSKIALIPVLNGKYFYMKSILYDFYLYADTDEFALDNQHRSVFLWMKKNEVRETGRWQLEPITGSQLFKIKNVYWNEYLSLSESVVVKGQSVLQLFTLRSSRCDNDVCRWNITGYIGA